MTRQNLSKIVYRTLLGLALAGLAGVLLISASDFFTYQIEAIRQPYSIDYGEGPLLDQTLRMANFENIYRASLANPPYTISNYPPLYMLLQVPFAWAFGPAFWYGRLINLLCVLLTALCITLTLKTLTRDWVGALVGGLLLLTIPYIHHWAKFNRIDELALALSWAALYATVRFAVSDPPAADLKQVARASIRRATFWAAVILFTASIYTRQTYALAAPFAAFFWLIFGAQGPWKSRLLRAVLLGLGVGGLTMLLFLLLNIATAGGFYLNIVVANVNAFFWGTVEHYAGEIGARLWPLLLFSLGFPLLELGMAWRRRGKPAAASAPSLGLWAMVLPYLLASAAGSITIGKDGSNVNYLLELSAALSLGGGAMLTWAGQRQRLWLRGLLQVTVAALLILQVVTLVAWDRRDNVTYLQDRERHQEEVGRVLRLLKDAPGPVLADEYMGLVPLAGKRLYFQPFEFKQLAQAKVWDEQGFLDDIAKHKFAAILWYQPAGWPESIEARWTPAQRQVIPLYYQIDEKIGDIYVYRPK